MKRKNIFGHVPGTSNPMDAALQFLGYRARTVREVERYLDGKQYGEFEVAQVIDRLLELGLLDDERFAGDFVESRLRTKPVSRRHLREQLYGHELPAETIERALQAVDEETERKNAALVAEKYWRQFEALPDRDRCGRVMQRLLGRGYDAELARSIIRALDEEGYGEETP